MNEVFWGLVSPRRYHPDQKNEIYNFSVVPDLQISKKVELLFVIYILVFGLCALFCHE